MEQARRPVGQPVSTDRTLGPDGLTERRREILGAIRAFYRTRGLPPTYRDLSAALGVYHGSINQVVQSLRRKGRIRPALGRSRGIVPVVPAGCCPCCERSMRGGGE
jgi:hypothetical protein